MAGCHTDGASNKNRLTAPAVNVHDCRNSGDEHDNSDDTCGQKTDRVGAQTKTVEDGWRVVQDGVDSRPLLEEHSQCRDDDALEHATGGEETTNSHELQL